MKEYINLDDWSIITPKKKYKENSYICIPYLSDRQSLLESHGWAQGYLLVPSWCN